MLYDGFQAFMKREFFKMIIFTYGGNIMLVLSIICLFTYFVDYMYSISWMQNYLNRDYEFVVNL